MGQYYNGAIIDRETHEPIIAYSGYKLCEAGYATMPAVPSSPT